jgi:hypothetical protein
MRLRMSDSAPRFLLSISLVQTSRGTHLPIAPHLLISHPLFPIHLSMPMITVLSSIDGIPYMISIIVLNLPLLSQRLK